MRGCALRAGALLVAAGLTVASSATPPSAARWIPWSESNWAHARSDQRLVLVHVARRGDPLAAEMERTAFAHPAVRELLANRFHCIRVDADQHPGVASALGAFVFETQQERGLPLNVWFTPDGLPVSGRTFLVPADEWGKPGLLSILDRLARRHEEDPAGLRTEAEGRLRRLLAPAPAGEADLAAVHSEAVELMALSLGTHTSGGPAASPVVPLVWRYLVQQTQAGDAKASFIWDFLVRQLAGPQHDPATGLWVERPGHDPAQLDLHLTAGAALAFLDAARATDRPDFANAAHRTLATLATDLDLVASPLDARAHAIVALFAGATHFSNDAWRDEASRRRADLASEARAALVAGTASLSSARALAAVRAALLLTPSHPDDLALIKALDEALARLRDERGLLVFPPGTALPEHAFADLIEDGARPSAHAWLVAADPSLAETWWRRHGRTVATAPDLHPALLHGLHAALSTKTAPPR